jgi:hypothetical protein
MGVPPTGSLWRPTIHRIETYALELYPRARFDELYVFLAEGKLSHVSGDRTDSANTTGFTSYIIEDMAACYKLKIDNVVTRCRDTRTSCCLP